MLTGLFRTKSLEDILAVSQDPAHTLRRTLGPWNVTMLGIGAIIGAGIFTTVGTAAGGDAARVGAGPSLMLSFVITAVVCAFTALCYAEFSSMVPISGSAYTYAYATLGEWIAWIIGWDLIIEYAVGNVAVAISWASYFRSFLETGFGIVIPPWLCTDIRTALKTPGLLESAPNILGVPIVFNLLAILIVAILTIILVWGIRESANFNVGMVIVKIAVLLFFVAAAFAYVTPAQMTANWTPFQPNGWTGTLTGAAVVFFAYIGFDAVSTVAEETRDPKRDLPFGIIASLLICTVIYVVVAAVFTGLVPYEEIKDAVSTQKAEPLTLALARVAPEAQWANMIVGLGAVVSTTAVLLVFQLGQPRIFFSMARDGLLPGWFASVHPRFKTPHVTTILTGVLVGVVSAFASIDEMVDLTNIGTLFAFVLVCVGIPILRLRDPDRPRPFRVPLGPFLLPALGVAACVGLMVFLPPASWWRFAGWLLLGQSVYMAYGYCHSTVGRKLGRPTRTPPALKASGLGFLLLAVGLFIIPHDAAPVELLAIVTNPAAQDHAWARWGLGLGAVGLVLAAGGWLAAPRAIALGRRG